MARAETHPDRLASLRVLASVYQADDGQWRCLRKTTVLQVVETVDCA